MPLIVHLLIALVWVSHAHAQTPASCTHYAAPQGAGSSCSASAPCKVASWWPLAGPGKVLCLRDGTYSGSSQMITPPPGLRGTQAAPITLRAEHDGGVTLDANHEGFAVYLGWHGGPPLSNDWFVVEGVNATGGREATYSVSGSDSVLRRVIGYSGTSGQDDSDIYRMTGYRSRAEDCAGWGNNARKIFTGTQSGNLQGAGYRRCWGEWNDHPQGDSNPNNTFELGYNSSNQLYENVIGTWNTTGQVAEVEGVMHMFGSNDASKPHAMEGSKVLGSIFYAAPGSRFAPSAVMEAYGLSGMTVEDTALIVSQEFTQVSPFAFLNYMCTASRPCAGNVCRNCLAVHAGRPGYVTEGSGWTTPGLHQGRGLAQATGGESAFTLLHGLCKRYEGGTLTDTPLWPWPMNERIKKARVESGFAAVDVTATSESLLGPIPAVCRGGPVEPPIEPPPVGPPPVAGTPLSCVGVQSAQGGVAIACVPQGQEGRR